MKNRKQTLSTEDISGSQHVLCVKNPNTAPAPPDVPGFPGSEKPRPVFHPSLPQA